MILLTLLIGLLFILWLLKLNKDYHVMAFFAKRIRTADGTPLELTAPVAQGSTIFGNTFDIISLDAVGMFEHDRELATQLKRSYIQYIMGLTVYNIVTAEDAELVFNDTNLITKDIFYNILKPSLGTGLLISTGKKWHSRRKLLTSAFHFNILQQFEEIFKEESQKFVGNLAARSGEAVSLNELIPKFTLNSICETALGVRLDDRLDGDSYRCSFKMIEEFFVQRVANPLLLNDFIFKLFVGSECERHLKIVHDFSSDIIKKRRGLLAEAMKLKKSEERVDNDDTGFLKKKRYAMLDTLLRAEEDALIDHAGICEEVDTFIFEGYDTTSMGLIFALMNLSLYPEMQQRCYEEIRDNIEGDLCNLDIAQLNNLKYLECFVKETLRMYPSVPVIGRKTLHETTLANNLILPANTQITLSLFDILRNPKYFANPDVFDPERFTPENSAGRHPFAYVPFSAGQRNCIGQKFAMLEMKTLIVYILKHFKLLALVDPKAFHFEMGLMLRTKNNVTVKLIARN